ncbi:unnamed protein product [Mortierella alpina]
MDNRKLIEQQMEKFKAIEKEMKTKAYSREGLIMSGRLDPKEKEKAETCSWVTDRVESLTIQMEALEAEVETLQASAKKGKNNPVKERISELEEKIERHKWHQGRLELILRLLENGQIETDKVIGIQEDVNYYVDENLDPDFAEDEEIYTDLNLEEEEDYFALGTEDHLNSQDQDDSSQKDDAHDSTPKKLAKESEPEPSPTRAAAKPIPTKKLSMSEPKEMKPAPAASPAIAKSTPLNVPPSRQSTLPRAGSVESPVIQYATAVAANLPAESPRMAPPSASPSVSAATVVKESPNLANTTTHVATQSPQATPTATAVVESSPASEPAEPTAQHSPAAETARAAAVPVEEPASTVSEPVAAQPSNTQPPRQATEEQVQENETASTPTTQSQAPASAEPAIRLPAALADLAHSFEASKDRALAKEVGFFVHQMLEASYQFIPEATDTERPKYYSAKNPFITPSYYPQSPPSGLFENAAMFEKFDIDTLFFIFYYQQGTYQQYLAARELKKQSWRFHKKYLTWFQRHEEPKAITDDYEQGTYIYFDYEGAWCQRKKTDFRFEYKFLEDSELV